MIKKETEQRVISRKFILTYLVVFLIPMAVNCLAYFAAYHKIEEDTRMVSVQGLEQSKKLLERRMNEIERIAYELYANTSAIQFSAENGQNNPYLPSKIRQVQNRIPNYKMTNDFILDYYIYFTASDLVINDRLVYSSEAFYYNVLRYHSFDYDIWNQKVKESILKKTYWPCQPATINTAYYDRYADGQSSVLTCFINMGKKSDNMSVIIVIDAEELRYLLSSAVVSLSDDYFGITDGEEVLYEINPDSRYTQSIHKISASKEKEAQASYIDWIDGKKVFVTRTQSILGWELVSIKPYTALMDGLTPIRNVILLSFFLSVIVGLVLVVLFSTRKKSPAMALYREAEHFRAQIKEQQPMLESMFMERLLTGALEPTQFHKLKNYLDFPVNQNCLCCVMQFFSDKQLDLENFEKIKIVLMEALLRYPGTRMHDIGNFRLTFLFECKEGTDGSVQAKRMYQDFLQELRPQVNCKIAFAMGLPCKDVQSVSFSLKEVLRELDFKDWGHGEQFLDIRAIKTEESPPPDNSTLYLLVQQMENYMKSGNASELSQNFCRMEAYLLPQLAAGNQHSLVILTNMIINMLRSFASVDTQGDETRKETLDHISKIAATAPSIDNIHQLHAICVLLAEEVLKESAGKQREMMDSVYAYLQDAYQNPDLSLSMIGDRFGISESYLSHLFKRYCGGNLSTHIEALRLTRASELLVTSSLSIQSITQAIGYNSVNTFNKAFRKKYGVSPTAYRNANQKKP